MIKAVWITAFICVLFCYSSCKKSDGTIEIPDPTGPIDSTTTVPDSVYILSSLNTWNGGKCNFIYDTSIKKYSGFAFYYNTSYWDSTFISYNANGTLRNLVNKLPEVNNTFSVLPTVFEYDGTGLLSKVYKKRKMYKGQYTNAYLTSANVPNEISYYDSINYDSKHRISSTYQIYYELNGVPFQVDSYRKFYYQTGNDSLLAKIELYKLNSAGNRPLYETYTFTSFNNKPNPFCWGMGLYGLCTPLGVTRFVTLPQSHSSYLSDFLTATPYCCTKVEVISHYASYTFTSDINYTFNANGLPVRGSYSDASEYVLYNYQKVKK